MEHGSVTMNISLPEPPKRFVETSVSAGTCGSASEFIREAIREKMLREQKHERDAKSVLADTRADALKSGPSVPYRPGHFDKAKQALRGRAKRGRKIQGRYSLRMPPAAWRA